MKNKCLIGYSLYLVLATFILIMSNYTITKDSLEKISFNEDTNILTIKWWTGGHENAVCGLKLKVELVEKVISDYKAPRMRYDPDYNEAF